MSHDKFVLTGRKKIRQLRHYVQSESDAANELRGVGDCKKIPASTQHHSNLFVGICSHGIAQVCCPMSYSESPRFLFSLLLQYWERAPSLILYDNACHASEYCVNREPDFFKNSVFVIDKFHYRNHTACSRSFNSCLYPNAAVLNSQICEQFNRILQKIAMSAQYSSADGYHLLISSFIFLHNFRVRSKFA